MTNTKYAKLTTWLIGAWFVVSLVASALRVFNNDPGRPPIALGLAVLIPVATFAAWFARSAGFRRFVLSLDARALTRTQSLRIAGYTFLVLYSNGLLPGTFALPAGWGDIAIGATASLVATRLAFPAHKSAFILWQALGILDLTTAITLGTTAQLIHPQGIATSPMTVLPLSLIPTFAVPLFFILHVICIAQARHWNEYSGAVERLATV